MRQAYLLSLPPGAGKTRTVLDHLCKKTGGNLETVCRNLLVLGPNGRVEKVWRRELAILVRKTGYAHSLDFKFMTFSEINKKSYIEAYAYIVIDEWHRLNPRRPGIFTRMKKGPLGNHTYFVSATPLNPVMESERQELIGSSDSDDVIVKDCRVKALRVIADLTGSSIDNDAIALPFNQALRAMKINWLQKKTGWKAPSPGEVKLRPIPTQRELNYFGNLDSDGMSDWKSREAAWAVGLLKTRYDAVAKKFLLASSQGSKKRVFGYQYVQPYVEDTKRKGEAVDWLLNEHDRVPRLLKLLHQAGVIAAQKTVGKYTLTKKKVLIFCVHQGVARGLQLALDKAIAVESGHDIFCAVHEDFTETHQNDFMKQGKAPHILITTDKLSESIDLHGDCNIIVHYELPWSPLRLLQRVGRLTRMREDRSFRDAEVYHIIIPGSVEEERVNRLVRRSGLLHDEGAWPAELYGEDKGSWLHIAGALIGSGPSMHLQEMLS